MALADAPPGRAAVACDADKESAACKEALAQFNKAVSGLGELIKAAQIQVSDASAAEAAKYSVDTAALSIDPCQLDIVLLPFDEDKGDPEEWQHFTGLLSLCWQQTPATLMHAACQCDAAPLVFTERSPASRASPQRPQEP